MNKLLILIFSTLLIGCRDKPKLLNNGLTKKVTKINEYVISVKNDSLGNEIKDTMMIIENRYNDNDQIINKNHRGSYADGTFNIEYIYNENNKIKKEIVKFSIDNSSHIVDYFYKDTLLLKTFAEDKNDISCFKQIGEYKYNPNNTLKQSSLTQYYIKLNDTIVYATETSKYNNKKLITEVLITDHIDPKKNTVTKHIYDSRTLIKEQVFNGKDSLISEIEYKYEFDEFKNWIKKESFENGKLNHIRKREIEYQ